MANPCRNPRTGQFISRRVQTLQRLADLPEREWNLDEQALAILEAGTALAIKDGWVPPAVPVPEPNPGWDEAHDQPAGDADLGRDPEHDPWIDALKGEADLEREVP
jgi:hypothetical protein